MIKYILPTLIVLQSVYALDVADVSGDVTADTTNTGRIISVAGASFKLDLSIASASIDVGNSKDTITNVNTIIIHKGSKVHNVNLTAKNSGEVINVGSKINLNSIIIGQ